MMSLLSLLTQLAPVLLELFSSDRKRRQDALSRFEAWAKQHQADGTRSTDLRAAATAQSADLASRAQAQTQDALAAARPQTPAPAPAAAPAPPANVAPSQASAARPASAVPLVAQTSVPK